MTKKQRKRYYATILILGLFLMVWQVTIFRNTIIDVSILIGIILVVGVITFLVDFKNYGKTYKKKGIELYLYSGMQYILSYGFIACSIFMLTNFYMADSEHIKETYEIVRRSSIPGRKYHRDKRKPTFDINYDGIIRVC
ncbi:hypothetical protein NBT05_11555 [Aquimarina sp. ERC-38]|uniref:hypothetical protein n=1 Tax=Aquimarina sp. ERC-38 TaxID=2949996 RepID=UPI0022483BE8|nr:hypothetical protein [Aquimarina sp. ERC-38]UZO79591.1 hypothetical protein NBT05_11555 [Aquimarina sp. ERC-38]